MTDTKTAAEPDLVAKMQWHVRLKIGPYDLLEQAAAALQQQAEEIAEWQKIAKRWEELTYEGEWRRISNEHRARADRAEAALRAAQEAPCPLCAQGAEAYRAAQEQIAKLNKLIADARPYRKAMEAKIAAAQERVEAMRRELFALCEDTEERYAEIATRDMEGKEGAFARGRIKEAKSIRNAMGEVFRSSLPAARAGELGLRFREGVD